LKREKGQIYVDRPPGSHVWQITKLMKALEQAIDSPNNRAAFRRTGLTVNTRVFPLVVLVYSTQSNEMFATLAFPEGSETDGRLGPSAHGFRGQAIPIFGFRCADDFPHE
jgi:hypothetical protein